MVQFGIYEYLGLCAAATVIGAILGRLCGGWFRHFFFLFCLTSIAWIPAIWTLVHRNMTGDNINADVITVVAVSFMALGAPLVIVLALSIPLIYWGSGTR